MAGIDPYLQRMADKGASDLYFTTGAPPAMVVRTITDQIPEMEDLRLSGTSWRTEEKGISVLAERRGRRKSVRRDSASTLVLRPMPGSPRRELLFEKSGRYDIVFTYRRRDGGRHRTGVVDRSQVTDTRVA